MLSSAEIRQYFAGVWQMMMGRAEGMKKLDLSVDGFWNSFFAIIVALPALTVGWVAVANDAPEAVTFGMRFSLLIRLFVADIGAWLVPLGLLGLAARPVGIANRFVHYVVASNWASALFAWVMLPVALLRLLAPGLAELTTLLALILFLATLVLSWRLTVVAIARGPGLGTAVFFSMLAASLVALVLLQTMLGLNLG